MKPALPNAESIATGLKRARRGGQGWMACCPAHDDQNPSLSITDREGGGVLVHCHAGCSQGDVIEVLQQRGLWERPETGPPQTTPHTYWNADGTPAFAVHRTAYPDGRKKIVQQLPDGQWKGHPAPRPLYHLPLIVSNPQEPVLVVEGEKTADAAAAIFPVDWVVTTSAGGSNAAKQSDWSVLKGRQVLIWPDNDSPGQQYAEDVKRLCEAAGAAHVSIFSYPVEVAFPASWDLADPFPEGFTLPTAEEMIPPHPEAEPVQEPTRGLALTPWSDAIDESPEQTPWIVDDMLPAGGLSIVVAKPKVGKSTAARCLAAAVVRGLPWLGKAVQQGPVIYLGLEEKRGPTLDHFRALGVPREAPLHIFIERAPEHALDRLLENIEDIKPVLVIIDPLFKFIRFKDGNDYAEATNKLAPLLAAARDTGTHLLATHHAKKGASSAGDEVLGSTGIFGAADCLLSMKRNEASQRRSCFTRQRYGTDLEESVIALDPETGWVSLTGTKKEADTQAKADELLAFLAEQTDWIAEREIKDGIGGNTRLISVALRSLLEQGEVVRTGPGKPRHPYKYALKNSGFPSFEEGLKTEHVGNQKLSNDSNDLDPQEVSGFPVSDGGAKPEKPETQMTIADYLDGLPGATQDQVIADLFSGVFGAGVEVAHSNKPSHTGQDLNVDTPQGEVWLN